MENKMKSRGEKGPCRAMRAITSKSAKQSKRGGEKTCFDFVLTPARRRAAQRS